MMKSWLWALPVLVSFLFLGCSSTEKNADTPEGLFEIAQEFEKDERFELSIQRYNEVKNKFPYSAYAVKARLAIADVHFKQEAYPEALASYQAFRELHPKHPQIDYVIYRIGLSHELPETVDRDLSLAKDAIAAFEEVVTRFPKSEYAADAAKRRTDILTQLAAKEDYIGDFYFKRGHYDSALPRYEGLLKRYPGLGFDAKALARAAIAAHKVEQKDKARKYLSQLKSQHPNSPELAEARKEIE